MPPIAIAAGIGAAGMIGGAVIGNKGAKTAAQASTQAADQAAQVQRETYAQNQNALAPFQEIGRAAGGVTNSILGIGADPQIGANAFRTYLNNSNYAFDLGQGQNAINSGYAGNGTVRSGAAMKGIEEHRQGLQQGYRGEFMNALANQQGVGFGAASAQAGVGQNFANSMSNIYGQQGNNLANAALLKAQNTGQMFNGLASIGANLAGSGIFGGGGNSTKNAIFGAKW